MTDAKYIEKARDFADENPPHGSLPKSVYVDRLAQALQEAVEEERERCVKIAERYAPTCAHDDLGQGTADAIAAAIRGEDG